MQCESRHLTPLGAEEWRCFGKEFATLVNGKTELHGLPAVGIHQPVGAWHFGKDVGLKLHVARVGIIVGFVGAIRHPVGNELFGQIIAQGRRPMRGVICGGERRVQLLNDHLHVNVGHG